MMNEASRMINIIQKTFTNKKFLILFFILLVFTSIVLFFYYIDIS